MVRCPDAPQKNAQKTNMAVILAVLPFNKLTQSIDINRFYRYIMMIILYSLSWKTQFFRINLCQLTGGLFTPHLAAISPARDCCLVFPKAVLLKCIKSSLQMAHGQMFSDSTVVFSDSTVGYAQTYCANLPGKRCSMMFDDPVLCFWIALARQLPKFQTFREPPVPSISNRFYWPFTVSFAGHLLWSVRGAKREERSLCESIATMVLAFTQACHF